MVSAGGLDGKESASSVGDQGLIPGFGKSLEEDMATHSNILAWRIPWTKEPGGLQSVGSQRVRHNDETTCHFNTMVTFQINF